ncbi:uncharacterized protein G2W53_028443 [Senna tora]|uniref:Uncharacterized protein n=1 Tax=Senna tora TaxID=362788 RepID=A0A834WES8_9FABA|nr:uncharacterized protein G2W53_028443 [Senna tora]
MLQLLQDRIRSVIVKGIQISYHLSHHNGKLSSAQTLFLLLHLSGSELLQRRISPPRKSWRRSETADRTRTASPNRFEPLLLPSVSENRYEYQ